MGYWSFNLLGKFWRLCWGFLLDWRRFDPLRGALEAELEPPAGLQKVQPHGKALEAKLELPAELDV